MCKDKAVNTALKLDYAAIMEGVGKILPYVGDLIELASGAVPWAPIVLKVLTFLIKREQDL